MYWSFNPRAVVRTASHKKSVREHHHIKELITVKNKKILKTSLEIQLTNHSLSFPLLSWTGTVLHLHSDSIRNLLPNDVTAYAGTKKFSLCTAFESLENIRRHLDREVYTHSSAEQNAIRGSANFVAMAFQKERRVQWIFSLRLFLT